MFVSLHVCNFLSLQARASLCFLMNLIWHSHIADLCIWYLASRIHSSCESHGTKRRPLLLGRRKSTCFQINLQIKVICCTYSSCVQKCGNPIPCSCWLLLYSFFLFFYMYFLSCASYCKFPCSHCYYLGYKSKKSESKTKSKYLFSPAATSVSWR